jgi:hypothetical protein
MRNLTEQELLEVENFKNIKNCINVFVDTTYSKIKLFPIFNEAQKDFIKEIFEGDKYSRFDNLINNTLETKAEKLEDLFKIYENEIDFLD